MTYFFVFMITMYLIGQIYNKLTIGSSTINIIHNRNIKPLIVPVGSEYIGWCDCYPTNFYLANMMNYYGSDEQIVLVIVLRNIMITVIISFVALSTIFCRFACYYRDTRLAHLKTILKNFFSCVSLFCLQ